MKNACLSIAFGMTFFLSNAMAKADSKRMQQVARLIGIESDSKDSERARTAVDDLVEMGLKSYPSLKAREAESNASRARTDAASANYQPTLTFNAAAARTENKDLSSGTNSIQDGRELHVVLRENIWKGGQDSGFIEIAERNEEIAEAAQARERESIRFQIRKAALDYNYQSLKRRLEEASLANARELSSLAERKVEARQLGKIDVHNAAVREAVARSSLARIELQEAEALLSLSYWVGLPNQSESVQRETQLISENALSFSTNFSADDEQVQSFEEKNAAAVVERAEIKLDQGYRRRFFPTVDLVAELNRTKLQNNAFVQPAFLENRMSGSSVQLQLNWTIWDRSQDHENRAAAFEKTAAAAQLDTARLQADLEARRLKRSIEDLKKNLAFAKEAYQAAGLLYDGQHKLYEAGVIAIQPLIDAERDQREAISNWQNIRYDLHSSILRWDALKRGYLVAAQ